MNEPIDWKARAEKAELDLANTKRAAQSCITDAQTEQQMLQAELERVQKAAAEMREAAAHYLEVRTVDPCNPMRKVAVFAVANRSKREVLEAEKKLRTALGADAGRDYHHRDEFKPLVEACQNAARQLADAVIFHTDQFALARKQCSEALADARQKGLIE